MKYDQIHWFIYVCISMISMPIDIHWYIYIYTCGSCLVSLKGSQAARSDIGVVSQAFHLCHWARQENIKMIISWKPKKLVETWRILKGNGKILTVFLGRRTCLATSSTSIFASWVYRQQTRVASLYHQGSIYWTNKVEKIAPSAIHDTLLTSPAVWKVRRLLW